VPAAEWGSLRPSRRVALVVVIALLATVAARIAAPAPARHVRFSAALACGVERWQVKTLQDKPRLIRAKTSTLANLTGLPRPTPFPTTRLPTERHIYSVVAAVTLVRQEADQDLHIVLEDGPAHMIAESPTVPSCTVNATAYRRQQMRDARNAVRLCAQARVVGVAFWDFKHNQTGVRTQRDRAAPDPRVCLPGRINYSPLRSLSVRSNATRHYLTESFVVPTRTPS
jgi:hypothetical protein